MLLISKFKLADADINLLYENSGVNIFIDRLQWAISYLKKFEYIKQNKISNKENFFSLTNKEYSYDAFLKDIQASNKEYQKNRKIISDASVFEPSEIINSTNTDEIEKLFKMVNDNVKNEIREKLKGDEIDLINSKN